MDFLCDSLLTAFVDRFLIFVIAEHIIFGIRFAIDYFVPDVPLRIARAMVWKDVMSESIKNELRKSNADQAEVTLRTCCMCFLCFLLFVSLLNADGFPLPSPTHHMITTIADSIRQVGRQNRCS
jgi:hypothetical protein